MSWPSLHIIRNDYFRSQITDFKLECLNKYSDHVKGKEKCYAHFKANKPIYQIVQVKSKKDVSCDVVAKIDVEYHISPNEDDYFNFSPVSIYKMYEDDPTFIYPYGRINWDTISNYNNEDSDVNKSTSLYFCNFHKFKLMFNQLHGYLREVYEVS